MRPEHTTFIITDDTGNTWPPRFVPRLTTPGDPLCIMRERKSEAALDNLDAARRATRSTRSGWGEGTIPGLGKLPDYIKLRPRPPADPAPDSAQRKVLEALRKHGPMLLGEIAEVTKINRKTVSRRLANLRKDGKVTDDGSNGRRRAWSAKG